MITTLRSIALATIVFMCMVFQSNEIIKAIVLINGEAFLVDVTLNGNIVTTYQKINNYFKTSESHQSILTRLSKGERSESGSSIVFYEKESEPIPSFTEENKSPIAAGNAQYLGFSPRRAILQTAAVDQIRKIADEYQSGRIQSIGITSYHEDSYESRSLARNRSQAIKDLLHAFGVSYDVISEDMPFGGAGVKSDYVRVQF